MGLYFSFPQVSHDTKSHLCSTTISTKVCKQKSPHYEYNRHLLAEGKKSPCLGHDQVVFHYWVYREARAFQVDTRLLPIPSDSPSLVLGNQLPYFANTADKISWQDQTFFDMSAVYIIMTTHSTHSDTETYLLGEKWTNCGIAHTAQKIGYP